MKKFILLLVVFGSLFFTGCNKDAQVKSFMKEFEDVTTEIAEKFDEGKIDEAKKFLDTQKKPIRAKWETIRSVWSFQVSDGVKNDMKSEPVENMKMVVESANKAIEKYPHEAKKIQTILSDLTNLLK